MLDPSVNGPLIRASHIPDAVVDDFWDVPESIPGFHRYSPHVLIEYLDFVSSGGLHADWDEGMRDNPGRVQHKTILYHWGRHQSVASALEMAYSMRVTSLEDEAIGVSRKREPGEQLHEQMDVLANADGTVSRDSKAAVKTIKKFQGDSPNSRRVHLTGIMAALSGAKTAAALLPLRRMGAALLNAGISLDDEFKGSTRRRVAQMAIEMANSTLDDKFRIQACQLALVAVGEPSESEAADVMPYTFDTSKDSAAYTEESEEDELDGSDGNGTDD